MQKMLQQVMTAPGHIEFREAPRVWQTTSAPVSSARMSGISWAEVRLLPSIRIRMVLLLVSFPCASARKAPAVNARGSAP